MTKKLIKFPHIDGFRHVVANINRHVEFCGLDDEGNPIIDNTKAKPVVGFTGTVKLHGTNASVAYDGEEFWAQSKNNIITPEKDNQGFAWFAEAHKEEFIDLITYIRNANSITDDRTIVVYGEWCGKGIQNGCAIHQLDKMFVIFGIKIATDDEETPNSWLNFQPLHLAEELNESRIYFIQQFQKYTIAIDFNKPEDSQNRLVEFTNEVEKECPVGKYFGVSGVGEGIVWVGEYAGNRYIFKVKGEKHTVSRVKTLANVDVDKLNNIQEFAKYATTENRLNQAINEVFTSQNIEINKKGLGNFLKWLQSDIVREEADTLIKNNLEPKDVNKAISSIAVKWFMSKYE